MSDEPFTRVTAVQPSDAQSDGLWLVIAWMAGLGACIVVAMAGLAFGPSGFGFAVVIAAAAFLLMKTRYRFGLRTFLIGTTLCGVWLGLKVGHDQKMERATTGLMNAGARLKLHDRRPNFPWGLWAERYSLDFYGLNRALSGKEFAHFGSLPPYSFYWLNLENTGLAGDNMRLVKRFRDAEFLSLANDTYRDGGRIPGRPQNRVTDADVAKLRGLNLLRGIDLSGTDVTDACVPHLLEFPHLIWITLDGTHVTGAGLARLSRLKNFRMLELNGCPIGATGFRELSQLSNLSTIGLWNTGMTDNDLEQLDGLARLSILRVGGNIVSADAVRRFSETHPHCKIER